jgi:hypothetical protein
LQEINLNISTEELLSAETAFAYADVYGMLGNEDTDTIAWLAPRAVVFRAHVRVRRYWEQLDESCHFCFTVDGMDVSAFARSPEHLVEICDIVLRLLAVSVVHSVLLYCWAPGLSINASTLAYLMEHCQSLKYLLLMDLEMDEDHCRVISGYSRPGLEIVLLLCKLTSAGASTLAEVLARNQGPTKLYSCEIDNAVLANGLRGNSSLKVFGAFRASNSPEHSNRDLLAIAGASDKTKA